MTEYILRKRRTRVMIKIKPFLKYKEYRNHIIKKYLRKFGIPAALISVSLISMVLSINILAKDNGIKNIGNGLGMQTLISREAQDNKTIAVAKVEKSEIIKTSKENEEKANNTLINNNIQQQDVITKLKELESENEKLKEDNLLLQNSVKIAASKGTRPKNYRLAPEITSRSGVLRGKNLGYFNITAYTPTKAECGNDRGITASGHPIVPGVTVAVDRNYWPIGTVFYIKGLGYVVAMDTGGAIKGKNRIDFAVLDKEFALEIGRKKFEVYLISLGNGKIGDIEF